MAKELRVSQEAIRDLDEIWDYIAGDSPARADRFVDQLVQKCREASELDAIGRARDELHPGMLSLAFKKYVIFFTRSQPSLHAVRILHGARDIGAMFDG